jgi:hypothetical protein
MFLFGDLSVWKWHIAPNPGLIESAAIKGVTGPPREMVGAAPAKRGAKS